MKRVAQLLAVLAVAAVFIYAGITKLSDPVRFAQDINNYRLLPWAVSVRLAFYLPWLEILAGLALVTGFLRRGGVVILSALTLIFLLATSAAKARGLDIKCGCFGAASENMSFTWHTVLVLALLAALAFLWMSERRAAATV